MPEMGIHCGVRTSREPIDRLVDRSEWRGDCLVWTGSTARGYGTFRPGTHSTDPKVYVHRYVFEQTVGPIPDGHDVDHVADKGCTSKACIWPGHLDPVTHKENQRRSRRKVCRAGLHDLTVPENVRWDGQGNRRGCKLCWVARARERRAA